MSRFTFPAKAEALAAQILTADKTALPAGIFSDLGTFLQNSETKLIDLMEGKQPPDSQPGDIEFGLLLYWIDTDHPLIAAFLELPPTQITDAMLDQWQTVLQGPGVVYADGTLVGYNLYEQLDPGWLIAAFSYILLMIGHFTPHAFVTNPQTVTVSDSPVTVAVVGDFGTGTWADGTTQGPAAAVMSQIATYNPDFTIHLGDVYYAGLSNEETDNLIEQWKPAGPAGSFFTLNSNHEMYDGANGYFDIALASTGPFTTQKGTSYFAIDGGSWIIIGLDTAYFDTSLFFMDGALTDSNQKSFISGLSLSGKKVFVMTHHNGISTDGSTQQQLFGQMVTMLGGNAPDFWYWGHVHNGIAYSSTSAAGSTNARCVGHGAIPFGDGYGLQNNDYISYYANTKFPNPDLEQQNRVLNGFALITFSSTEILEQFFDQEGCLAWSQTTQLS